MSQRSCALSSSLSRFFDEFKDDRSLVVVYGHHALRHGRPCPPPRCPSGVVPHNAFRLLPANTRLASPALRRTFLWQPAKSCPQLDQYTSSAADTSWRLSRGRWHTTLWCFGWEEPKLVTRTELSLSCSYICIAPSLLRNCDTIFGWSSGGFLIQPPGDRIHGIFPMCSFSLD